MLRKLFALLLMFCMILPVAAFATEDQEDVSIADVLGGEDTDSATADAAVPDSQAQAPVDPAAPVYELDGSIVIKMTFTGDFTIGDNLQTFFKRNWKNRTTIWIFHLKTLRIFWKKTT